MAHGIVFDQSATELGIFNQCRRVQRLALAAEARGESARDVIGVHRLPAAIRPADRADKSTLPLCRRHRMLRHRADVPPHADGNDGAVSKNAVEVTGDEAGE